MSLINIYSHLKKLIDYKFSFKIKIVYADLLLDIAPELLLYYRKRISIIYIDSKIQFYFYPVSDILQFI